jgi:hypothetical protein
MQGQERYVGRIVPDMDACDINGDKIGTVAHVYRHEFAGAGVSGASGGGSPAEDVVEVKTGFLGLGKHFYIPMSAVQEVTQGSVFVSKAREELPTTGWERKPAHLDEMR